MGLKWECPVERTCSAWALSYFADCVCSTSDMISFFFGIMSIICWGLVEIPQIVVNWRSPVSERVSLAFIFTWMIGDIFNLAGCWINPGTIPTQFYLAVLYSATTVILVVQQLRSAWTFYRTARASSAAEPLVDSRGPNARPPRWRNDLEGLFPSGAPSVHKSGAQSLPSLSKRDGRPPLPVAASLPVRPYSESSEFYPGSVPIGRNSQSPGTYSGSWRRLTLSSSYGGSPAARGLLVSSLVIVGVTLSPIPSFDQVQGFLQHHGVSWVGGGRRQLQEENGKDIEQSVGLILGWLMTCIYLTGRLPQIILNCSREFVVGVSSSTVFFAFLGNTTYLASLLVRGVQWSQLKLVLPWIVDISCCLLMDFFMLIQFWIQQRREGYMTLE